MTPADLARNNAISLEAKKDALSQRQSGDWKVSFTVQGIDMDTRLTQAPMGTRYAMVLVEIDENELPVKQKEAPSNVPSGSPPSTRHDGTKHGKMDWRELQPAAQAGIRCADPVFIAYLKEQQPNAWRAHQDAASLVRWICGVKSRSELGTNHLARVMWKTLDDQFQVWLAKERVGA
jgi:hypothetical protein